MNNKVIGNSMEKPYTAKDLARRIKKLLWSNRFTLDDISNFLDLPLDKVISTFESYYNIPIPPSLLIVGNLKQRQQLTEFIKASLSVLVYGPNGTGKKSAVKLISNEQDLTLIYSAPLKKSDIIISFGRGPLFTNTNLYVVDINSIKKNDQLFLLQYLNNAIRPIIIIADDKDKVHKKLRNKLKIIKFTEPSSKDVEYFLKKKYNWEGKIEDIYDRDMRVVISRVLGDIEIKKPEQEEELSARVLAFMLSCGYAKLKDFNRLNEPFWWLLRWLGYNQDKKFNDNELIMQNLEKISVIDENKFRYNPVYLQSMVSKLHTSHRRTNFTFPPWPIKKKEVENRLMGVEILKKPSKKANDHLQSKLECWL